MGNTEKNESKKFRRRIKIRLVDPNILDSYVCEITDSSLEEEKEISKGDPLLEEKKDDSKPKNYFELLMSKKSRKGDVIKTAKQIEVFKISGTKELFHKKSQKNQKNLIFLNKPLNVEKKEITYEAESSDDGSLLQIQKKFKIKNCDAGQESNWILDIAKEKKIDNKDVFGVFQSPKVELSHKKTINILNYFSKSETNLESKVNCANINDFFTIKGPLTPGQTKNALKPVKAWNSEKSKQVENVSWAGINKENATSASLFYKKESKILDSDGQKARLEFLHKELPSVIKKSENKTSENVLNFPKVPHVQQRNDSACWFRREIRLPLPEVHQSRECIFNSSKKFSLQIKHLNVVNNLVTTKSNIINKEVLCKLKCKYLDLNLNSVFDGLIEKKDKFFAETQEIEKSKFTKGQINFVIETGAEELNTLWTEKYKPKSSEILGNGKVVKKLKKWLQSWKSFDEESKILVKCNRTSKIQQESDGDSADFLDSGHENLGLKVPNNVCIISGPNGCGKTALVYALANELEFGILELNASSRRTGKKVLSEIQEATQSHKVHRVNVLQANATQKQFKKKGRKTKKSRHVEEPPKISDQTNDCKISLILIEDADIVFDEHDEGFFSAISSLVQTSKRPLIFLTNEPNCPYLYNLNIKQCLILEMEFPNFYKSCAILDLISLLEGGCYDEELLKSLVLQNNFDLRKSLLQLQFWIHSGKNSVISETKFDLGKFWWGLCKFLYKQNIRHFVKPKSCKRKRNNDLFDSSDDETEMIAKKFKFKSESESLTNCSPLSLSVIPKKIDPPIESYFEILDVGSTLDAFRLPGSVEPIPGSECKPKDSLSLDENMEEVSWFDESFKEELSNELVTLSTRIFAKKFESEENESRKLNFISPCWEEIRWRNSQEKASEELSVLVPLQRGRDNRSLYLDYLPTLRYICRVEKNRSEMNPKRKNRFYHYLNNLGFEPTDENLEINCGIFCRK